jgi:predicted nucleic acid-binding protein
LTQRRRVRRNGNTEDDVPSLANAVGHARISTIVAALVDTNVLVYRFDPRDRRKQEIADSLLRTGIASDSIRIPHQALVEFYRAVTRSNSGYRRLLEDNDALRETEEMLAQFSILFPDESVVRTALRGMAAYQLSWFDAHMWAYAEAFGLSELISEDFQHGRLYGSVRVVNPFK